MQKKSFLVVVVIGDSCSEKIVFFFEIEQVSNVDNRAVISTCSEGNAHIKLHNRMHLNYLTNMVRPDRI